MRTTINLDDVLLRRVKELAARNKRTFTSVVEDALRQVVNRGAEPQRRKRVRLPVSMQPPGLQPGVDLDNSAALLDLMEQENAPPRR
jgi:hypothetical protein